MRILYKILLFLLLSPLYLWAQIDWMGEVSINKNALQYSGDSLVLEISVKKEGVTSKDPNPQTIRSKILLLSSKYRQNHSDIQNSFEIEMQYLTRNEDKYIFRSVIPVNLLEQGRYILNFYCSDDNWNTYTSLKKFDSSINTITIGNLGFVRILSNFNINDDVFKYSILDFNNQNDILPDKLSGTYSEGFCSDEIVDLKELWFQVWSIGELVNPQILTYYSIDGGDFIEANDFIEIDNSTDGSLEFDNISLAGNYNSNEDFIDYSIKTNVDLRDLLNMVDKESKEIHSFEMFFILKTSNNEIRFPQQENIKTELKISNSPRGADCQAELLPIDLLSFDVIKSGKKVHIKWITASEINNDNFEIQRSSNAQDWDILTVIDGKGNTSSQNKYEYTDQFPIAGESYYRLKQNDFDGREKYSKVKVIYNFENKLTIYPNPASDYLFYNIRDINNDFDVVIYNNMGKMVKTFVLPDKTRNNFKIDISFLKKGTYFIKYINKQNHQVKVQTFIKT